MNGLIQLNKVTAAFFVVLGLGCFCLSPLAQAQGCASSCSNNNTAVGGALGSNTTGGFNTAIGFLALQSNTTGFRNTATGYRALFSNTTGGNNTAIGIEALLDNTGDQNTAAGSGALVHNTTGMNNTATGFAALAGPSTASANTANGAFALTNNTGTSNTAIGAAALQRNTTGNYNMASGFFALQRNTTGEFNTATGAGALLFNTADENTATGAAALVFNTTGEFNTAAGSAALFSNTTGAHNTANGFQTLVNNTTGNDNVALGFLAGSQLTTGDNNIDIGNVGVAAESATIRLGTVGTQTKTFIAAINGVAVAGTSVFVNTFGQLGTAVSSRRFKEEIQPMNKASEALFGLEPVTFRYKKEIDADRIPQFGLVAEEVAKVNPALVVRDNEGKPYTVRYEAVNAMLLNEFLKEHKAFVEEQRKVEQLEKQVAALTAGLQKVSAQLEVSKAAPQTVLNDQ